MDDFDKFMNLLLSLLVGSVAVGGALFAFFLATHEEDAVVASRRERFTLDAINPPKHFYVDLTDARGVAHKRMYVSKHCNNWRSLTLGQALDLEIVTYRKPASRGGETYERILTGGDRVCPAS